MSRDPELPSDRPTEKPSRGLAVLGAVLPFFATSLCCMGVPVAMSDGSPERVLQEMGVSFWAILLGGIFSGVVCAVLVAMAGLGKRIPSFVAIGFAALPWVIGLAGARYSMFRVEEAISFADPAQRSMLMAAGLAEAFTAHVFGSGVSMGALVGVGLGLSLGALAQRAPKKKLAALALGLAALPLLGAAGYLASIYPLQAMNAIVVALAAFLVLALGAYGIGADAPNQRSGALASAGAASMVLAFVAACTGGATMVVIEAFQAIASVDSASKPTLLAAAAEEIAPFRTMASVGLALGLVPMLAVAGYAAARARPTAGRLVGAGLVVMVLVVTVALDVFATRAGVSTEAAGQSPWASVDGFVPVAIERSEVEVAAHAVVALDGAHPWSGGPAVPLDESALAASFRALLASPPPRAQPDWALPIEPVPDEPAADPEIVLVLDARLDPAALRAVLAAAGSAGAKSVRVVGSLGEPLTDREREAVDGALPAISFLLEGWSNARFFLESSVPPGTAEADPRLLHGTIGRGADVTLSPRAGSDVPPIVLAENAYPEVDPEASACYLALAGDAGVGDLVTAVSRAGRPGYLPIVVLGDIPGHPELRFDDPLPALMGDLIAEDYGVAAVDTLGGPPTTADEALQRMLGEGGLGTIGGSNTPSPARVDTSTRSVDVRGSLSREIIQRVIRAHLGEVRHCYERGLASNPALAGRVTVSFVISAMGTVQSATVQSTTLENPAVEDCIIAAAGRWQFPPPDGGGIVAVNYPFVLEAAP